MELIKFVETISDKKLKDYEKILLENTYNKAGIGEAYLIIPGSNEKVLLRGGK